MPDVEEQIHDLADHYFAQSAPVRVDAAQIGPPRRLGRLWLTAAAVLLVVGAGAALALNGRDSGDRVAAGQTSLAVDDPLAEPPPVGTAAIEDAFVFQLNIVNVTGAQHLSLSDYLGIAAAACGGAVNDDEQLLALARTIGGFATEEAAASSIWLAARQVCPQQFADQDFEAGPPFGLGEGWSSPELVPVEGLPDEFADFVDLSVLDETVSSWSPGQQLLILSTTPLSAQDAVQYFRDGFPSGWNINEVIGPFTDPNGLTRWSIDVDSDQWTGVVDISTGNIGVADRDTLVVIVFAAS